MQMAKSKNNTIVSEFSLIRRNGIVIQWTFEVLATFFFCGAFSSVFWRFTFKMYCHQVAAIAGNKGDHKNYQENNGQDFGDFGRQFGNAK